MLTESRIQKRKDDGIMAFRNGKAGIMEYLFTERAHLMCPHMCFGIAADVRAEFDEKKIRRTLAVLADAHPFLCARLGHEAEKNRYFYDVTGSDRTELIIMKDVIGACDSPAVMKMYEHLTGYDWDLFSEGMLKAAVWKSDAGTGILFVFHHLLADGRSALELLQEFADYYADGIVPGTAPEKLISSKSDFPKGSELPFVSKALVNKANRDWTKEGNSLLSYPEYHEYADRFVREDSVAHRIQKTEPAELENMIRECREHAVTLNDLLMARMFAEENTDKIVIACDLRDRLAFHVPGALGNYSTAFSITVKKNSGGRSDRFTSAKEIHKKVQKTLSSPRDLYLVLQCYADLNPGLLDAAFMAARGAYGSKAAAFIGKMFFGFASPKGYSVTNLGRITAGCMDLAYFIPPASPAVRKTWGVLTVNDRMVICTSER